MSSGIESRKAENPISETNAENANKIKSDINKDMTNENHVGANENRIKMKTKC